MSGDALKGAIEGKIEKQGYFNFNVEVADAEGASAQAFLTVNIQPKTILRSKSYIYYLATEVVSVPSSNSVGYNIGAIEDEQIASDNELFSALDVVSTRKDIVSDVKGQVAIATLRVNKAQASFNAADVIFRNAVADKVNAQERVRITEKTLNAAEQNLELALIEQGQATIRLTEARQTVQEAQNRFKNAQRDF